jgi:peptidoglycan hydrolase CwlO-like protein
MLDKISLSLMLFFNTLTTSVDPHLSDERKTIQQINKEIKSLQRKIEWIQVTDTDYASRTVRTNKITDEITTLKGKIVKIEKVAKLKEKWAVEDSVALSKK